MGAVSSVIFGEKVTSIEGEWITVTFDANMNEVSTVSATVTDYPVEDGSNITDNAIDDPDEIQIDGLITNTPADLEDALTASATRAEDAYGDLVRLKEKKETVEITTTVRTFEDMFITRISRTRNAGVGDSVQFNLSARKIRKVQSSVAEVPLRDTGGKGAKKTGGVEPNIEANPAQNQSFILKGGRAALRFFGIGG